MISEPQQAEDAIRDQQADLVMLASRKGKRAGSSWW
jgi:hypothetical protein